MGRSINTRPLRDKFYIITNGKETEYNYFSLLKQKKSLYEVCIEFQNKDPLGLVEYACKYKNNANQIWVVFDIDNTYEQKRLIPAIKKAEIERVKYAFSNISFEVWLISHFEQCSKEMSEEQLERKITDYLKKQKEGLVYDKSNEEQLKKYFIPNYPIAVENAKIVYQTKMAEHNKIYGTNTRPHIWRWNSSTNVFQLIEALKLGK